jgi:molybdopterin biosynthesis enzyme
MRIERRTVHRAAGTILVHNVADERGGLVAKKGVRLTVEHLGLLIAAGCGEVEVAVMDASDVHEDEAATRLADALRTGQMTSSRPAGGRVNLRAAVDGLLEIDEARLLALNLVPGIGVGTRRPQTVAGPNQESDNIATVKILPFALPRARLEEAIALAEGRPGILELRPFRVGQRAAMLLVGEPGVWPELAESYVPPTRARVERLAGRLEVVERCVQEEGAVGRAAGSLLESADLLVIAGQTSIMDEEDTTLRALRAAGAEGTVAGTPVEPGNMLALTYLRGRPVVCVPACAKSLRHSAVDMVLPRLMLGDRLGRPDIAALGSGGFLTAAERGEAG